MSKYCPHCHYSTTIKYGYTSSHKERYLCKNCHKTWTNKSQPQRRKRNIWHDYVWLGLSYEELAKKYHCHSQTIRNIIVNYPIDTIVNLKLLSKEEKAAIQVIMMDTTYFGRSYGVVVIIDAHTGRLLHFQPIEHTETTMDYYRAITTIEEAGIHPKACVVDGRAGVRRILEEKGILVQYCLFHIRALARRCLTNKPVLKPNIELKDIVPLLCNRYKLYDRKVFETALGGWRIRHGVWMNERTRLVDGTWEYTHRKTRLLVRCLLKNMDYFYTYEKYPELNIPRFSNRLEGLFGNAKHKLRLHRGYSKELKTKVLYVLLSGDTGVNNNTKL